MSSISDGKAMAKASEVIRWIYKMIKCGIYVDLYLYIGWKLNLCDILRHVVVKKYRRNVKGKWKAKKNLYIEINTEIKFSWEPVDSFPGF